MPESPAERLREQAAESGAPDPVEQDSERLVEVEAEAADTEAKEHQS